MRGNSYQIILIFLGVVSTLLFGVFFYRELYPEYRVYQKDYQALEKFRSSYTGDKPPPFKEGIKQIVMESKTRGPAEIDRCISCHLATQLPHFSPTTLKRDLNGEILLNARGIPEKVPNKEYVWAKLDAKVAELTDEAVNRNLEEKSEFAKVAARLAKAKELSDLKTTKVHGQVVSVEKALQMHPLIGREVRPFQFHPIEQYGCTSCHGGNGRALTLDRAHGPLFDGTYAIDFEGDKAKFLEVDKENDPRFAELFNYKPGGKLLFQTSPLLIGPLMEANCVQCHQARGVQWESTVEKMEQLQREEERDKKRLQSAFEREKQSTLSLILLRKQVLAKGIEAVKRDLEKRIEEPHLFSEEVSQLQGELTFLRTLKEENLQEAFAHLFKERVGSDQLVTLLEKQSPTTEEKFEAFLEAHKSSSEATGSLFEKMATLEEEDQLSPLPPVTTLPRRVSDLDLLTKHYYRGEELFLTQACYACHRINGLARGGIGPELTEAADIYPWHLKQSIVWPQGDLPTSTMPNYHLDHQDVEDLMAFLLGQKGENRVVSPVDAELSIQEWEAGKKLPWEKPLPPAKLHDLRESMQIFATEGCAACHRLQGFESNVGFALEKEKSDFDELYEEREWFRRLFPEQVVGSRIAQILERDAEEIDQRIVEGVRQGGILEEIEEKNPELLLTFYTPFKFARRAKNHLLEGEALEEWQGRVDRVLKQFIQEYGLGRQIGPKVSWSGIYRTDEWLMDHFKNPSGRVPGSIMPAFPFDQSKFYALTSMLNQLAVKNRARVREVWEKRGFNPARAFEVQCAQCHGDYRQADGPVADWIYPIPKNLRNADFMRNLTKKRALFALIHGVKGTPMPPWGEVAVDKPEGSPMLTEGEAKRLIDWLFETLPGETVIRGEEDVLKWQYQPEDVIEELEKEKAWEAPKDDLAYAALTPSLAKREKLSHFFNIVEKPTEDGESLHYYIKEEFYTQKNIEAGRQFFLINCAVCHGPDGDGTGVRASSMITGKPRALTNLDWIRTRDDLRLLRSIKYGVSGTAMTAWGEMTDAEQRMQLVLFIRSLTQDNDRRDQLLSVLYHAFEEPIFVINQLRSTGSQKLLDLERELRGLGREEYEREKQLLVERTKETKQDQKLIDLIAILERESALYREVGLLMIQRSVEQDLFEAYLKLIDLVGGRYALSDQGTLVKEEVGEKAKQLLDQLIAALDQKLAGLSHDAALFEGKIPSVERDQHLKWIAEETKGYQKVRQRLLSAFFQDMRLQEKEKELLHAKIQ